MEVNVLKSQNQHQKQFLMFEDHCSTLKLQLQLVHRNLRNYFVCNKSQHYITSKWWGTIPKGGLLKLNLNYTVLKFRRIFFLVSFPSVNWSRQLACTICGAVCKHSWLLLTHIFFFFFLLAALLCSHFGAWEYHGRNRRNIEEEKEKC